MFLDYFPIKYRNFSKMFVPLKIITLGVTNVDFGFTTLDNISVKILEFSKFKLIEFRKRNLDLPLMQKMIYLNMRYLKMLKIQN